MNLKFWESKEVKTREPTEEEIMKRCGIKRCPKCNKNYKRSHNACPKDAWEKIKRKQSELKYYNCPYCDYRNLDETVMWYHCQRWHQMLLSNRMFENEIQSGDSVR